MQAELRKRLRLKLAALTALGALCASAAPVAAQDGQAAHPPADARSLRAERPRLSPSFFDVCSEREALDLCVESAREPGPAALPSEKERPQSRAPLTKLSRLAGMFMGRVPAGRLGPWQIRIDLSLR